MIRTRKNISFIINQFRTFSLNESDVKCSLKSIFGNNFTLSESVRHHYAKDESLHKY